MIPKKLQFVLTICFGKKYIAQGTPPALVAVAFSIYYKSGHRDRTVPTVVEICGTEKATCYRVEVVLTECVLVEV